MTNLPRLLFISALLMMIAGCASVTRQPAEQSPAPGDMSQESGENILAEPEPRPAISENRAIVALLDKARHDTEAGKREAAGASLERALRIEPRNPWLWHELAQLRLSQGQYERAIAFAHKSNSFASRESSLQALNWQLIGKARVAQGNPSGAEQAYKRAEELQQ